MTINVGELKEKLSGLHDGKEILAAVTSEGQEGFEVVWDEVPQGMDTPVVLYIDGPQE